MGELLDGLETLLCLGFKFYYINIINDERMYLFHISSFIFKLIISCFRSDEDRHGSLSKNLVHLITTIFQAIIQYKENPNKFMDDIYNIASTILTILQDFRFIIRYFEQKQKQQRQQLDKGEHMA
ncbi:hypothetical protein ACTFIZ_005121 [Dictyostelium cf. discoideum]